MIQWVQRLRIAFGTSFLWLVCLIYFTQVQNGVSTFRFLFSLGSKSACLPLLYEFVKVGLQVFCVDSSFLPAERRAEVVALSLPTGVFNSIFPMEHKTVIWHVICLDCRVILSDCIPIRGRKRVPYLVIATVLSLLPWLILGQISSLRSSRLPLMIILTVQNLGSAMADVVVDAMIAEAVRVERASFAGDLQSLSWMAMALGGICGSLLGGYALSNLQIETIFLLFSILPAIQLFSCGWVNEDSIGGKDLREYSKISHEENGNNTASDADNFAVEKSKTSSSRRKKIQKNSNKRSDITSKFQVPEKGGLLVSQWFQSLRTATYSLLRAFRQPIILRWSHVGLSVLGVLDMVLVSRTNAVLGVSDKVMVLCGSALSDAVNQFKFMPFLILSGQLCPPGIEGTLFALFMSINNFGSTLGSFVGAGLASFLNISSGSFDNLLLGVGIQVLCTFIPIAFLFLIPKEATGISA
ncbi:hypothetical protein RHGRI_009496 [Rhododendron griersonianum]|uniref:Biopterin transport-related protein BT1 n=1 Tax=Rhododendron griersonianum TaxID=479676 RepID=A0AAV6KEZ7_9ERIC|nr:hypothetical protein RHGRI_009496 [Rhododendron griersonianum]